MAFFIERIIVRNRAPFANGLELNFSVGSINVLSAVNGKGKTTLLSYIMDAFVEITRGVFTSNYEDRPTKYYRISSSGYNVEQGKPSCVYIRFNHDGKLIDYLDIRNKCSIAEYNTLLPTDILIPYNVVKEDLEKRSNSKKVSQVDSEQIKKIWNSNVATYFPSYRHFAPLYLNQCFRDDVEYSTQVNFSGELPNPLEVRFDIKGIVNWLMDITIDAELYKQSIDTPQGRKDITPENVLWNNICTIVRGALVSKYPDGDVRLAINKRAKSGERISVTSNNGKITYCPSIFNLSSGELEVLNIFGEIVRQADRLNNNIALNSICGIVLIDEIDMHLHIRLQKEVIPALLKLLPNVQFIISSHSPFLSMGLAEIESTRTSIIDLDNDGVISSPETSPMYNEVYQMMLGEKNKYAEMFYKLQSQMAMQDRPILITEGKTDIVHLRNAQKRLGRTDVMVDFAELPEGKWSDAELKKYLDNISKIKNGRPVIGMFDRDVPSIVTEIEQAGGHYKTYSSRVYGFCIPVPVGRERYNNISIEFYYKDEDIRKEKDGRRLFFDNEIDIIFNKSRNSSSYQRLEKADTSREENKRIFDETKMCEMTDYIHSKKTFADLLESDEAFSEGVDYSTFNQIFDRIVEIQNLVGSIKME